MGGNSQQTKEAFTGAFESVQPLICAEWPEIDQAALAETGGDFDKVVALVSAKTEHTKTLVRRQLGELHQIAVDDASKQGDPVGRLAAAQRKLQETMRNLQSRAHEMSEYLRTQALTDAKAKAEQHPLVTLLMAVGLGFIIGFVLRGLGRGRQPPTC